MIVAADPLNERARVVCMGLRSAVLSQVLTRANGEVLSNVLLTINN